MSTFSWVYKPYFLRPAPPLQQKSTHQHFLSAKNSHENNKYQAKKVKVYGKKLDFQTPHPPPPKVYDLYTRENVNIYGWPLMWLYKSIFYNKWLI